MNILVCIKQVPDDSVEVTMGADGKPAVEGITPVVNAFDTYALEMATRLKETLDDGSEITALCIGPDSAKNSLKNCLAVGADYAYLVNNESVDETDAMGIAHILKGAVEKLVAEKGKFDLIFVDPPYDAGLYEAVLKSINLVDILSDGGIIVCEARAEEPLPELTPPYRMRKEYRYGKLKICIYMSIS